MEPKSMTGSKRPASPDHDICKGAVEQGSFDPDATCAPGLDEHGLPNDFTAIAQDAIGARSDGSQG
jgi:hypothetical protein